MSNQYFEDMDGGRRNFIHAGDPGGGEIRRNKQQLANAGASDAAYDEADQFIKNPAVQSPSGGLPPQHDSPYSGRIHFEDDVPKNEAPTQVPSEQVPSEQAPPETGEVGEPENLLSDREQEPRSPSVSMDRQSPPQPAPKKQGFFGRIGGGLKRMWSGIRSLFGGGRAAPAAAPASAPQAPSGQWFDDERPQVERDLVAAAHVKTAEAKAEALAPKRSDLEKQDWDSPNGAYAKFGLPMSRAASRNPARKNPAQVRLDKDSSGNKVHEPWYKQAVVNEIDTNKKDKKRKVNLNTGVFSGEDPDAGLMTDLARATGNMRGEGTFAQKEKRQKELNAPLNDPNVPTDPKTARNLGMEHLPGRYGQMNLITNKFFEKFGSTYANVHRAQGEGGNPMLDLPEGFQDEGAEGNPLFDKAHKYVKQTCPSCRAPKSGTWPRGLGGIARSPVDDRSMPQ